MSTAFEVGVIVVGVIVTLGLEHIAHAILAHAKVNADVHNREVRERRAVRAEQAGEKR